RRRRRLRWTPSGSSRRRRSRTRTARTLPTSRSIPRPGRRKFCGWSRSRTSAAPSIPRSCTARRSAPPCRAWAARSSRSWSTTRRDSWSAARSRTTRCPPRPLVERLQADGARYGVSVIETEPACHALHFAYGLRLRPFFAKLIEEPAQRLASMAATGIDREILSTWTDMHAHALGVEQGVAWHRLLNESLA